MDMEKMELLNRLFSGNDMDPVVWSSVLVVLATLLILLFLGLKMVRLVRSSKSREVATVTLPKSELKESSGSYYIGGMMILLLSFGLFGGWASYAPLDSAVVTLGRVTVESNRKTVQHLEGGIVSEILVKDGDQVVVGQPLLKMSETQPRAQLEVVEIQLMDALTLLERLQAELDERGELHYSEQLGALVEADPTIAKMATIQHKIFQSRKQTLDGEISILEKRIGQMKVQIDGLEQVLRSKAERISSYQEEISEWEILYQKQLADKQHLRQIRHQRAQMEAEIAEHKAQIAQLRIQIGESEEQILLRKRNFQAEVVKELRETQSAVADYKTRMTALSDTLARTVIRSPEDGTVVGMELHTEGAVIGAGKPIMHIVPGSHSFVIEAEVPSTDIDKVVVGLKSDIRFSAFKSFKGVIPGDVIKVSADSFTDERTGVSYYDATIRVAEGGYETMVEEGIELISGMPAEVIIKTGSRTLLDYIVQPFSDMFVRSFREE